MNISTLTPMPRPEEPIVAPALIVELRQPEMMRHNRWDPGYYDKRFRDNERELKKLASVALGEFIPDLLADGSKGITYGQVGARKLNPRGSVRYLQVINNRDTGIDFSLKPDRVAENSHNDPARSRVRARDILFTNNAFRGTDTLIGRCVVVPRDYGKVNISQHIDRIRVAGISPFYVCVFLKSRLGTLQVQRVMHGVDSTGISFPRIRALLIPPLDDASQTEVETQYLAMSKCHDRAMAIKERLLEEHKIEPGQYGEAINALADENGSYRRAASEAEQRLKHIISELEAVLMANRKSSAWITSHSMRAKRLRGAL